MAIGNNIDRGQNGDKCPGAFVAGNSKPQIKNVNKKSKTILPVQTFLLLLTFAR